MDQEILQKLEQRLGRRNARRRLGLETDHEAQVFGQGLNFFHIENLYSLHWLIRGALMLSGLYWRGQRNAERVRLRHNAVVSPALPPLFDGFTILHISDMHVDMNEGAMQCLIGLVGGLDYDLSVLTGDYRGKTAGPFQATLDGLSRLCAHLKAPITGVLGNHYTIQTLPRMQV